METVKIAAFPIRSRTRRGAGPALSVSPLTHSDTVEPQTPPVRTLKIEAAGDFWCGRIQPKIRLTGRWLKQAGFPPGARVRVICAAPGVIELRVAGLVNPPAA